MSLRTDKVSGIITWTFGGALIGFASFGLLVPRQATAAENKPNVIFILVDDKY